MNQNKALAALKDLSKGIDSTLLLIGATSTVHSHDDKLYLAKHKNLMWLSASYQGPQHPYLGRLRNTLQEDNLPIKKFSATAAHTLESLLPHKMEYTTIDQLLEKIYQETRQIGDITVKEEAVKSLKTTLQEIEKELGSADQKIFREQNPLIITPSFLLKPAKEVYNAWHETSDAAFCTRTIYRGNKMLPPPNAANLLLIEYLHHLHVIASAEENRRLLNSFVQHIRNCLSESSRGFLNELFPEKRTFSKTMFLQGGAFEKITSEYENPLSADEVQSLLTALYQQSLNGRSKAQKNLLSALAFAWICLYCAYNHVEIRVKNLYEMPIEISEANNAKYLDVYSERGKQKILISNPFADYLNAVTYRHEQNYLYLYPPQNSVNTDMDHHLKSNLNSLGRTLTRIGKNASISKPFTFTTLLKNRPRPFVM